MDDSLRKIIYNQLLDHKEIFLYNQFIRGEITINWKVCKHCGYKTYCVNHIWDVINKQNIRDKKIDDLLS